MPTFSKVGVSTELKLSNNFQYVDFSACAQKVCTYFSSRYLSSSSSLLTSFSCLIMVLCTYVKESTTYH